MPTNIIESDFIAAKELAYCYLSAIEEISLASGNVSTYIYKQNVFTSGNLAISSPDQKFSRITRAVEYLCKVLDSSGIQVKPNPLWQSEVNWDDSKTPGKISKVKKWLLLACNGEAWQDCNSAHEKAYRLALEMWSEIERSIALASFHDKGSYKRGRGFHLELELIEENAEEVREQIRNCPQLDFKAAKAGVEWESAKASECASQITYWEKLKNWAMNNWFVVILIIIVIVVSSLVSLGTDLQTLYKWICTLTNGMWP
jgi:hypothetical protein